MRRVLSSCVRVAPSGTSRMASISTAQHGSQRKRTVLSIQLTSPEPAGRLDPDISRTGKRQAVHLVRHW